MIRNTPPYKQSCCQEDMSTGYKLHQDLEQGQRQYQQLLDQNNYLRDQIRLRSQQPQPQPQLREPIYTPAELERMSSSMVSGKQFIQYQQSTAPPSPDNIVIEKICPYEIGEKGNMAMYNLAQRNRYLEKKIEALRGEYEKQTRMFHRLGEKARAHSGCYKDCYEQRYYELLRITSPE